MSEIFSEFALLLLICAVAGAVARYCRQPVLIAYILVGILVGPSVFGMVTAQSQIDLLAQIGIAVLLFMVGLKLDLHHVRHIGPVALATGLGQLFFTIVIGFGIILALGKGVMDALYIAVALTFSSTIIIVKLLSDKRELDSLHGRIAIGFLIVQDLAVVLAMMAMSALRSDASTPPTEVVLSLLARIAVAMVLLVTLMRYVLPVVVARMAQSSELLLIFAIAWGTSLAALGEWAGFSKEAGAFLAGFSLASTQYRDAINARLSGIRDFLLVFFFIDLGARFHLHAIGDDVVLAIVLSLFVLIGNPLIVMAIMGYMGYRKRTGFLAGLTVAQISEFSIIFVAMGISLGHVGQDALSLTTLVGLVTIALSSYMILYSQRLFTFFAPLLSIFERRQAHREVGDMAMPVSHATPDVIIIGLGRYGQQLARGLQANGIRVLGVDADPETVREMLAANIHACFGDGLDDAMLEELPLSRTRWLVSTLPDPISNKHLLQALHRQRFTGRVAVVARHDEEYVAVQPDMAPVTVIHPVRDAVAFAVDELIPLIRTQETTP